MSNKMSVGVKFYKDRNSAINTDKVYEFFTDLADLVDGDDVVVRCSTGLQIGYVVSEPNENYSSRANAWVIDKIDFSAENKRKVKAELEAQLKRAIEETSVLERAKQLAALNPNLAALIAQLEELDK